MSTFFTRKIQKNIKISDSFDCHHFLRLKLFVYAKPFKLELSFACVRWKFVLRKENWWWRSLNLVETYCKREVWIMFSRCSDFEHHCLWYQLNATSMPANMSKIAFNPKAHYGMYNSSEYSLCAYRKRQP